MPALTFWATGSAALMSGGTLVIVDVDPESYCIDFERQVVSLDLRNMETPGAIKKVAETIEKLTAS